MGSPNCFMVLLVAFAVGAADDAAVTKPDATQPTYAILAADDEAEAELRSLVMRLLADADRRTRFKKVRTLEELGESRSEVLVVINTRRGPLQAEPNAETLDRLKSRKIIGIGEGAAQLFGKLGLLINLGACAHGFEGELQATRSALLGEPEGADPFPVFREVPVDAEDSSPVRSNLFGMFVPPQSPDAEAVDVLARWVNDANYAPAVRQGNCILFCVHGPASRWTQEFREFVRDACHALVARDLEQFAKAKRKLTKPGRYEFELAPRQSTHAAFTASHFLQFREPTRLTVRLEHSGSSNVMLLFSSDGTQRLHWTRLDARRGEPLELEVDIEQQDIAALGEGHWLLKVTNFDDTAVDCKLEITTKSR